MKTATHDPICLIVPPSIFLLDERVFVNLGILKVAAVLEQAGQPVEVLDLSGIDNFEEVAEAHLRGTKARVIGLTSTTPQMPQTAKIAALAARVRPDARLILGGPHVTLVHTAYKKECARGVKGRATRSFDELSAMFDCLVSGDGEHAVFQAIPLDGPALVDANVRKSPLFMSNAHYESSPFPARHLVDMDSYHYRIEDHRATSLIAQLGCPFACGFCGGREAPFLRTIRTRTPGNIIKEVESIHRAYGHTGFMFYDDELNVNPKMTELMTGLIKLQDKLGVEFRLRGFVKSELFTAKQAELMYQAGFRWLLSGFESGDPRILANMNKKATREDNTACIETASKYGLKVKALMSIGHPGESAETVAATKDWLLSVKPADFDVTIITTYPGTPYYDHAVPHDDGVWMYTDKKSGDRLYAYEINYNEVADYYKGDPDGGYRAYVYTDHLSSDQLVTLRDGMERDVRKQLGIPFNPAKSAVRYEHSMGQMGGRLPTNILKSTTEWDDGAEMQEAG